MKSLIDAIQSSKPACGAGIALSVFAVFLGVVGFIQPVRTPMSLDEMRTMLAWALAQKGGFLFLIGFGFALLAVFVKPFRRSASE